MRLLLIGCTGFIGSELIPLLLEAGHELIILSRRKDPKVLNAVRSNKIRFIQINPATPQAWESNTIKDALAESEGVINLAGEPIADKRWTKTHKNEIEISRLNTTKGLINAMHKLKKKPRVLINASAIGYYGSSLNECFNEKSSNGSDFLAKLCQRWEALANQKPRPTRLVILRIGIVLSPDGGALGKMLPIFKAGLGGPIGDGKQWMSWIHRTDLCEIILQAIANKSWSGPINAVAPEPVLMKDFSAKLGKSLKRPNLLPVPGAILELLLGDGAKVVLEGQNVISNELKKYNFKYRLLEEAIAKTNI